MLDAEVRQELQDMFGERASFSDAERDRHGRDEAYLTPAKPDAVVWPSDREEVAALLRLANRTGTPVVPFGVGTSLEGHVIPRRGGISVDMSGMDRILEVHEADRDAVIQPGVRRRQLDRHLRHTGLFFPVDPGADATLGGMAATRASGTCAVRYGTMRENVLALEVVLPNGRIVRAGGRARKSSSGYDLRSLFVGSEGTLGIVTELTLRLFGRPQAMATAACFFETLENAVQTVIETDLMGIPAARIELIDEVQMRGVNLHSKLEFPESPALFVEFHGTDATVREQAELFGGIAKSNGGSGFQWATATEDRERLWRARHDAYYAGKALRAGSEGYVTDACVPISRLADCILATKKDIAAASLLAPMVGHAGDGNFHLTILIDPSSPEELAAAAGLAERLAFRALEMGGTVTGEHGVGMGKRKLMAAEHGEGWNLMGQIKQAIDPNNIMNPGKIVPDPA